MATIARPTNLKLLAREKPSRINTDEPQPEDGVPACPSTDPDVVAVWDYTLKQLLVMRTVTMADRDLLHAYCEQVVLYRRATKVVSDEGILIPGMLGRLVKNPAVAVAKDAATQMRQFGAHFGLTPSSRSSIKVADQKPAKPQGAGRLLTG